MRFESIGRSVYVQTNLVKYQEIVDIDEKLQLNKDELHMVVNDNLKSIFYMQLIIAVLTALFCFNYAINRMSEAAYVSGEERFPKFMDCISEVLKKRIELRESQSIMIDHCKETHHLNVVKTISKQFEKYKNQIIISRNTTYRQVNLSIIKDLFIFIVKSFCFCKRFKKDTSKV